MDTCKLCRFVKLAHGEAVISPDGEVQPVVIAEDEYWIAALNENQATLGRVYMVLKRHETDVSLLTTLEQESLWRWVSATKAALVHLFTPEHFNYMFLMNVVSHAHFHVYPRYSSPRDFHGDRFYDPQYGGHYDPVESRLLPDVTRDTLAAAMRDALNA